MNRRDFLKAFGAAAATAVLPVAAISEAAVILGREAPIEWHSVVQKFGSWADDPVAMSIVRQMSDDILKRKCDKEGLRVVGRKFAAPAYEQERNITWMRETAWLEPI